MTDSVGEHLLPPPGGEEEIATFTRLQHWLSEIYRQVFSDDRAPRTVVIIPSLTLDRDELAKIPGVVHYEERMLCLLMLLRMPRTEVVYVTSMPIDSAIIDYYLHLLPGVPNAHALSRLKMISIGDPGLEPLTAKLLARPDVLQRIRDNIRHPEAAHMTCFNSTPLERTLAVQLGIPMYAADPALGRLGGKSGGRAVLRESGLRVPDGFEDLRDRHDVAAALLALHERNPGLSAAVVKINEGFSGEGNALISLSGLADVPDATTEIDRRLIHELQVVAEGWSVGDFFDKLEHMGGIAEAIIDGARTRSPSVQVRIDPAGTVQLVSTHDQLLGGGGQVFTGCTFPARAAYRVDLHDAGFRVGTVLRDRGVVGRFSVDFVSVRRHGTWEHFAIEINLRKGGTTLPYLMLEFLTDGTYDAESGTFRTPMGDRRTYYATDNLVKPEYLGLTPTNLIDLAVFEKLHFDASTQEGLVFHLLGAVEDHGKLGLVSIAEKRRGAFDRYQEAVQAIDAMATGAS